MVMEFLYLMFRKWNVGIILTMMIQITRGLDLYNTLNVKKCLCDKYKAWDGTACYEANTTLPIQNTTQKHEFNIQKYRKGILTSNVENVSVTELECPEGLFRTILYDNILLLPDGRLLWLKTMEAFTDDVFCIEHVLYNGETYFEPHVCLPLPAVPRCCPNNHLLGQDGSCHPRENLQPPPITLKNHPVDWDHVDGEMETPSCSEYEDLRQIRIKPGEGQLDDTGPTAELLWDPPIQILVPTWRNRYCLALQETETGDLEYVAQICWKDHNRYYKRQCKNKVCISKCCNDNKLLFGINGFCTEDTREEKWPSSKILSQEINQEWKVVYGEPDCQELHKYSEEEMYLLSNGFLQITTNMPAPMPPSRYCLGLLMTDENLTNVALVCVPEERCKWRDILIKVTVGISCVCLVVTLGVYVGVAELRDHTYGRCLISMVIAMLIAYACYLFQPEYTIPGPGCYTRAFFKHLGALAMFFWLNVMCFDMWKIIRGSTVQHHSMKMFVGYSLYAWGCPTIISTVTLILDITSPHNIILPEYNEGACWFHDDRAYWAYFSGFIIVLVVVNIIFFIHVAVTLYQKMKQRTRNFETNSSRSTKTTKTKQQVWLFAKLFVVMGVVWIFDVLSAIRHRGTCTYWVFTDIINSLQGVLIFIVVVCNKDNLRKIKNAWRPRVQSIRQSIFSITGQSSQHTTRNNLSIDYTDTSRKTSVTSLPRKISQVSNILFPGSSKKTATINPSDTPESSPSERKGSNVSIKEMVPLSSME